MGPNIKAHQAEFSNKSHRNSCCVTKAFDFISQKDSQDIVDPKTRFCGYDGLHLDVTLRGRSVEQFRNPVIEIQVMTTFM